MTTRASKITPEVQPDPFRFGWRYVDEPGSNGCTISVRQPLTPEDLLHPQEHDVIVENSVQERDRRYLASVLEYRLADRPQALVLSDLLIDWGVPGMRNSAPDVCVMDDVRDRNRVWKTFRVVKEGARPVLAIEIVSLDEYDPGVRDNDVVIKRDEYHRAGVPLYVIVDWEVEDEPRTLIAYRWSKRRYVPISTDAQGRLVLEPVGLVLALRDNRAVCFDVKTGEEIPGLTGMAQARLQAEQARLQAEQARLQAEAALAKAQARIQELESQAARRRPPRKNGRRAE